MKLGTFWLVSDVQCESRSAPHSCHDVAGQDIDLDFQEAQLGCEARLGSSQVQQDRRLTEKQAPAGAIKAIKPGFSALAHTKRVT